MNEKLGPVIPQPLRGEMKVEVQLPDEVRALLRDAHNDREGVAIFVVSATAFALLLATIAVIRYVVCGVQTLIATEKKP